jgi:hypothetical protein
MKSGGSSSSDRNTAQPANSTVTAYGNATAANPYWASVLPTDPMASAQLGDPSVQRFADNTVATPELIAAQEATPIPNAVASSSNSGMSSSMKKFLAELMIRAERDKDLARINKESASGGSKASGSFGGSSGGLY